MQGLQPGSAGGGDEISIGELLVVLVRHARLIVVVTVVVTLAMAFWVGQQSPGYTAEVTVRLDPDSATGSIEELLASKEPAAAAEIAIVQSRSLAESTVGDRNLAPLQGEDLWELTEASFDPVPAGQEPVLEGVGLTTLVESHDRRPWVGMVSRLLGRSGDAHRLRARMRRASGSRSPATGEQDVLDLDVHFVDEETLRIAPHEGFLFARDMTSAQG
ncbi:MAG: Wzz/FepE/Etk N-terminal domain-containing protein, partial [Planctomycetota bacterium]|nr:Wzz/FepE/Etk N-terminal domain-containing protein [Planctomycetota bacterium]